MRVLERRQYARFFREPRGRPLRILVQHLDRHELLRLAIKRSIYRPHAADSSARLQLETIVDNVSRKHWPEKLNRFSPSKTRDFFDVSRNSARRRKAVNAASHR